MSTRVATETPLAVRLFNETALVLGQEDARRQLAVLLARQSAVARGVFAESIGALAFGRTGVGKTMLIRDMCRQCGLPFAVADATQFTDKGYIGPDLTQMFLPLIRAGLAMSRQSGALEYRDEQEEDESLFGKPKEEIETAVRIAQTGVILLDEFDKWLVTSKDQSGRDVGRRLQAELLNIVQGMRVWVSDREDELGVDFDTSRCMVICCGAFVGLHDRVLDRLSSQEEYEDETLWTLVEPRDFVKMGIIPELAGRLATLIPFKPLRPEHLSDIIEQEGGFIDEYRRRFLEYGCELLVLDEGMRAVSAIAIKQRTGARGLRHVLERLMAPAIFRAAQFYASGVMTSCRLDVEAVQNSQLEVRER